MEHFILRVRNPEATARVIAEMVDDEALPLPPLANCWFVLSPDGKGLEVHPDILNRYSIDADPFATDKTATIAVGSPRLSGAIIALAKQAGWPFRRASSRVGEVVEVAVEGRYVLVVAARPAQPGAEAAWARRGEESDQPDDARPA